MFLASSNLVFIKKILKVRFYAGYLSFQFFTRGFVDRRHDDTGYTL